MDQLKETPSRSWSGVLWLAADLLMLIASVLLYVFGGIAASLWMILLASLLSITVVVVSVSFFMVQPNQAAVLMFFGDYRGTETKAGLRIANPLYISKKVSLRVRNFTTQTSKVNDARGNPIEIAAVVVWRVVDTARAMFGVDDFKSYVHTQSDSPTNPVVNVGTLNR